MNKEYQDFLISKQKLNSTNDQIKHSTATDGKPPVIRRRHKWDNPNDKISATCIKCGCRRFAEKFSTGMSWVYIQKGKVVELTAAPCLETKEQKSNSDQPDVSGSLSYSEEKILTCCIYTFHGDR